jgi:flagellar motor switch protein FliN/FliY
MEPLGAKVVGGISIILLSSLLARIADPDGLKKTPQTAEEIKGNLLGHLAGTPVAATARLGTATATMREIASLEPGDILLLDRTAGEPVELVITGNIVQYGLPVESGGCYALQILDRRLWPQMQTRPKGA